MIVVNGDTFSDHFRFFFKMNIKVSYEIYISKYNVFQVPFEPKARDSWQENSPL